ncbi:MAG: hypothetical protein U0354_12100 [Candidatus Sericytochromatia bacterium]
MNKILLIIFFTFIFIPESYAKNNSINNNPSNNLFQEIKYKYNVDIRYTRMGKYFPDYWIKQKIDIDFQEIDLNEVKRFPKLLDKALSTYSLNTIKKYLKNVNLFKSLYFYKTNYGATYDHNSIYMTSNGIKNNYTDSYLINIFHHEFSSLLLMYNKFPEEEWKSWSPRGFKYNNGGLEALKNNKYSLYGSDDLYKLGLLSEYSLASFEEDFNVYSGLILENPNNIYKLIKKYPYIKEKFKIWIKYYNSIDPQISEKNLFKSFKYSD